jgi:hypothetical protein
LKSDHSNPEKSQQEETPSQRERKDVASTALGRKEGRYTIRLFWTNSIVTKCLKAGIEESFPRQRTTAFPL